MMFKFLHAADIHLDSPLLNLDRRDDLPREMCRNATRRAFDNLVELGIREQVAFVLIAGDVYDGDCSDFKTPLYFRGKMNLLREHGIRVVMIQGNHDAANTMTKAFALQLPDNVVLLSTEHPETVRLDDWNVAIHGQGFANKAVSEDLSADYPRAIPGCLNIGLLHTSCRGHQSTTAHDPYAPSTLQGLVDKGYDYWALGHIHIRQRLAGPAPWIVYSGNPQGRHVGETGPRGCVVVTCDRDTLSPVDHEVDVLRWEHLQLDVSRCEDLDAVASLTQTQLTEMQRQADGRPLIARVTFVGRTAAHDEFIRHPDFSERSIREMVIDHFGEEIWIEKLRIATTADLSVAASVDSATTEFLEELRTGDAVMRAWEQLGDEFESVLAMIPNDPRLADQQLDLRSPQLQSELMAEAEQLLASRLLSRGETS